MGIKGLLPFVERACRPSHVQEFKGKRVAIDVSCLLHRGVFGCVESIAQGLKTDFCMKYVEKYLKVFFHFECEVYLIFDGKRLQAKQIVNDERKEKRDSIKRTGEELMSVGLENEAYKVFRQGIGVPKEIQDDAITYFTSLDTVNVMVSPYEADAQMAFMIQNNIVDVVVTEDSDLIVFGASKIIFKLKENGACLLFEQTKLPRCLCPALAKNFKLETFRRMCIMSGCDYLPSGLNGVGLKKAEAVLSKTSITDIKILLRRVPSLLNNRSIKVTPDLIESFIQAEKTFMYQIVYDPLMKCQRPLNFYPGTVEEDYRNYTPSMLEIANEYEFAGTIASPSEAEQMSKGILSEASLSEDLFPQITLKTVIPASSNLLEFNQLQYEKISVLRNVLPKGDKTANND
ncbi:unnamed protein product [Bursaphelenchus xylophilus]|uniref:Exonuclease 1 n=1 Tax=Bursaphelenchus xylophilus TaxID=6326 RepID=A0A7I8WK23_BURXY|nr:unnamed protein product [Bursaphelenchus xylophilus]CAG9107228.1 unnamed protein product [Bursaphelenchus xylophilus]